MTSEVTVESIGDQFWTARYRNRRALFAEGDGGVVVFNTMGSQQGAQALRNAIQETCETDTIGTIVYTLDHLNHTSHARELAADPDILAHQLCKTVVQTRNDPDQPVPTRVVEKPRRDLTLEGVSVTLLHPGPTSATGNLAVYFQDPGVLFSANTILPDAQYGILPDYHLRNFVDFMRQIGDRSFDVFVPGRGRMMTREEFFEGCDYIESLETAAQEAFAQGVPIWELDAMEGYGIEHLSDDYAHLEGFTNQVGLTLLRIAHHYLMGGWGLEDTPNPDYNLA